MSTYEAYPYYARQRTSSAGRGMHKSNGAGEEKKLSSKLKDKITAMTDSATKTRLRYWKKDYFESGKRGELHDWKQQLCDDNTIVQKEAVKKVIAAMTIGKDVSPLFPYVLKCVVTKDSELKRLVYLYLQQYASDQPELAILAINSFVKDCADADPAIRSRAIKVMSSLRVECISEYVLDPLRKLLRDPEAAVRRSAVMAIAKIYDTIPEVAEDFDLAKDLQGLFPGEINSGVSACILSALIDIDHRFRVPRDWLSKVMRHMNECQEWSQLVLLQQLSSFCVDAELGTQVCDAIAPFLQHANIAVCAEAFKALVQVPQWHGRLAGALSGLLTASSDYVRPEILYALFAMLNQLPIPTLQAVLPPAANHRLFFLKYNDLPSVKMEKLQLIPKLMSSPDVAIFLDSVVIHLVDCVKTDEVDPTIRGLCLRSLIECAHSLNASGSADMLVLVVSAMAGLIHAPDAGNLLLTGSLQLTWSTYPDIMENIVLPHLVEPLTRSMMQLAEDGEGDAIDQQNDRSVLRALIYFVGQFPEQLFAPEVQGELQAKLFKRIIDLDDQEVTEYSDASGSCCKTG